MWQKATDQVQKRYSMDCQGECRDHNLCEIEGYLSINNENVARGINTLLH